eukprot:14071256-Alexandrium_andersonii.AAC.1
MCIRDSARTSRFRSWRAGLGGGYPHVVGCSQQRPGQARVGIPEWMSSPRNEERLARAGLHPSSVG